jgi:hypothetical protein
MLDQPQLQTAIKQSNVNSGFIHLSDQGSTETSLRLGEDWILTTGFLGRLDAIKKLLICLCPLCSSVQSRIIYAVART